MHFNAYRKKRYEKFQAVSFCESTPGNLDFIRMLSSVYYSWLYEGHSLGQRLAVGLEVCQPPCSAGDPTQVSSVYKGWLHHAGFALGRSCSAQLRWEPSTLPAGVSFAPQFYQLCVCFLEFCRVLLQALPGCTEDVRTVLLQGDKVPSPGSATVFYFVGTRP